MVKGVFELEVQDQRNILPYSSLIRLRVALVRVDLRPGAPSRECLLHDLNHVPLLKHAACRAVQDTCCTWRRASITRAEGFSAAAGMVQ